MTFRWTRPLAVCLCIAATTSGFPQSGSGLSNTAFAVKRKVETLPPQSRISVIPRTGQEEFGTLLTHNDEEFTFHDVDENADVTLKYEAVKKVKGGYGGYNSATGHHVDRKKVLIIAAVTIGVLGALIGAAAAAKN